MTLSQALKVQPPESSRSSLLEGEHLFGGYTKRSVVQDVNLTVHPGEWLTIVGGNGSGKSTLLRLLSRILKPQRGVVRLDGKAIQRRSPQEVARSLAILPQQSRIPMGLTVRQLVGLGRAPHQNWWQWEYSEADHVQIDQALAQTQLSQFAHRPVAQLSGGERQRAFLALALAQKPKILILDEPTTFLDIHYQLELLELLKQLNREQNLTIVTVLHELNLATRYSDRLAMVKDGKLFALGTPTAVMTPENLRFGFGVEAVTIPTPVGLQICVLGPASV
ncbi:iron ABC transporter ATP-binding protein (plasmid) [Picosynechococcus sp. PCC 7003]|uniref:ABC transporter ATP-binding protein n=1 Tax=Picosynechococcus sp. PCC 7003 TaxID=374981 RepID=UPI0008106B3B|nr:ABC transporter ATP-binding protein [Picosynechococcus sp. PCC 7003]ANV85938.1 iron ABC transporter ATP-binding protein [Picosynechococcus sp. PCC 7003]